MKTINKLLVAALLATPALTGCIEESIPTNIVTGSELEGTQEAVEAFVWAQPSHLNTIETVSTDQHYSFGWSALMHARDCMTGDMVVAYAGGYNWFGSFCRNSTAMGPRYMVNQFLWNMYYEQVNCANTALKNINFDNPNAADNNHFYMATTLAFRAGVYLDLARWYEVLPNELFPECKSTDGKDILGLTVPIVTEETTEDELRNNPRVPHDEMVAFILNDLNGAVAHFAETSMAQPSKTLPSLAVTYGLLARTYLWDASYQAEINGDNAAATTAYNKAAEYARKSIAESGATPLTEAEWTNTSSGFNDINVSSWMWGGQFVAEDDAVVAGAIRTWTSFCCNEQTFGYAGSECGATTSIDVSLYNKISNKDWRKLSWTAPEKSSLYTKVKFVDNAFAAEFLDAPYLSLKFRPGQGNLSDGSVAAAVAYPMMRVEEMYLIEAEATAHVNPTAGLNLLKSFMTTYRYPEYSTIANDEASIVDEIILQKRIELWGEGQTLYDIKRLNMSVTRYYDGTNFEIGSDTFNTNGRPAWMNLCIVNQELDNNDGIKGYQTPTSAGSYQALGNE